MKELLAVRKKFLCLITYHSLSISLSTIQRNNYLKLLKAFSRRAKLIVRFHWRAKALKLQEKVRCQVISTLKAITTLKLDLKMEACFPRENLHAKEDIRGSSGPNKEVDKTAKLTLLCRDHLKNHLGLFLLSLIHI